MEMRGKKGKIDYYPLRGVPMANAGQGPPISYVSAPLNTGDVRESKKEMGEMQRTPLEWQNSWMRFWHQTHIPGWSCSLS